jgi:hypothetical protein
MQDRKAVMKWRGPIGGGAASGKVGALVASRAKQTQYLRARISPVNPNTTFQQVIRNAIKSVTQLWSKTLSALQRQGWSVYAQNVTRTNVLGDSTNLSGVNWFVGNNVVLNQAGLPTVLDAPIVYNQGALDFLGAGISFTVETDGVNATISTLESLVTLAGDTTSTMLLYVSRPFSAGLQGKAIPQATRFAGSVALDQDTVSDYTFTLPFAALGVDGSDTGNTMRGVIRIARADGRVSPKFELQAFPP